MKIEEHMQGMYLLNNHRQITDSFGDESKSEGQFAVVSFAYIGGILKMLRSEEHLATKEYPLVLDGPFSKLDPDQRQNVIDMIRLILARDANAFFEGVGSPTPSKTEQPA